MIVAAPQQTANELNRRGAAVPMIVAAPKHTVLWTIPRGATTVPMVVTAPKYTVPYLKGWGLLYLNRRGCLVVSMVVAAPKQTVPELNRRG